MWSYNVSEWWQINNSQTTKTLLDGDENKWSFNLKLKDGSVSSKLAAFAQISGSAWKNHLHLGFSVWSDCQSIARYNFSLERYNIARYNFSSYSIASALRTPWWGLQLPLTSGNQTSNHYCRFHSLLVIRYWCWSTLPLVNRRSRVRRIMAKKTCFLVRLPHPCEKPKRRRSLINAYHWLSSTHIGDYHVCLRISLIGQLQSFTFKLCHIYAKHIKGVCLASSIWNIKHSKQFWKKEVYILDQSWSLCSCGFLLCSA